MCIIADKRDIFSLAGKGEITMGNVQKMLEQQADRIEATLAAHRTPSRVTGGTVTPRWVRFQVLPAVGSKLSKIKDLNDALAASLGVPDCRVARRGAAFDVEIPRDNPKTVRLLPLLKQLTEGGDTIPPVTATLGLADDGAPLLIRLPSPDVGHVLVCGVDGTGKTTLLQDIALSLAMTNEPESLRMVNIDLGGDLDTFTGLPHLARPIIQDDAEAAEALLSLACLMDYRCRVGGDFPVVVAIIDELTGLLSGAKLGVQNAIADILQRGHTVGIYVIAATREPVELDAFPVRILGKMQNATEARAASGWTGTGAERLQRGGDFIAVAEGRVIRFQAAYVTSDEIDEVIDRLQSQSALFPGQGSTYHPTAIQTATVPSPSDQLAAALAAGG
jgi:S-DNA-T family DNA segregation ATPase FtsK/SpoIIIE